MTIVCRLRAVRPGIIIVPAAVIFFLMGLFQQSSASQFSLKSDLKNEESGYSLSGSRLNPGNLMGVPSFESISLVSFEPKALFGDESFLKGLLSGEYRFQKNDGSDRDGSVRVRELYFSTAYKHFSFDIGRERVRWGVGYSASPTDIVTALRRLDDPEDRLNRADGTDIAGVSLLFGNSSLSLVYMPDLHVRDLSIGGYSFAARYKTFIKGMDISAVFLAGENKKLKAGINSSYVIGEALELHGEFLWSRRQTGLNPDYYLGTNALYPESPYKTGRDPAYFALLGGQYTVNLEEKGALNIVLEYYRNGDGLSREEMAEYAGHIQYSYDLPDRQGYYQSVWAAEAYRFPLGTDYLFLRLDHLFFNNRLRAELNTLYSLSDRSLFFQPVVTWYAKDNLSFYVRGTISSGRDGSEADISPVRSIVRVGCTYSF